MMIQLNPPLPVEVEGRKGYAILVIDYSQEHHLLWTVAFDDNGEIWCVPNSRVRMRENLSLGRDFPAEDEP